MRVVVRPWEDGKLRRGGGGGGDLEGFSVRYLGTVNSSRERTGFMLEEVRPFTPAQALNPKVFHSGGVTGFSPFLPISLLVTLVVQTDFRA